MCAHADSHRPAAAIADWPMELENAFSSEVGIGSHQETRRRKNL